MTDQSKPKYHVKPLFDNTMADIVERTNLDENGQIIVLAALVDMYQFGSLDFSKRHNGELAEERAHSDRLADALGNESQCPDHVANCCDEWCQHCKDAMVSIGAVEAVLAEHRRRRAQ